MRRNLKHFLLNDLGSAHPFRARVGGGGKSPSDVLDRTGHARSLLHALDQLPPINAQELPGIYLQVNGRPNEPFAKDSLGSSGIELLRADAETQGGVRIEKATVFATPAGVENLRKKIQQFELENTPDRVKDDRIIHGRPRNANLVQSIAEITEAGLRALWRGPKEKFPLGDAKISWEVWLDPNAAELFSEHAVDYGLEIGPDRLNFPEDIVVICHATHDELALAVRRLAGVRALAAPAAAADFFDSMDVVDQVDWVQNLVQRTEYVGEPGIGYITFLDTGISRAHPLIAPALAIGDRHAVEPAWSLDDIKGHGTQLAGLALFGDLSVALEAMQPVRVSHRLESVKLLPDAGVNPHFLLGTKTRQAVDVVEATDRRRIFAMAVTTDEDTPHDGAPTSWSSELDQLASGVSGENNNSRLFLVSAGNTDNFKFGAGNYLDICDGLDNELESPAQAWNIICVGAFTEKTALPAGERLTPAAPFGDLSPSSRTASWSSTWPIKPDIVLEGGNWAVGNVPPPMRHPWLGLLTTHHSYPRRSFSLTSDTSAATALAAKQISELWADYPSLWPETIRALYVSSARWTPRMRAHLPANPTKSSYAPLFKRYGFGVPDLDRARRSASNAISLVIQDTIVPYGLSEAGHDVHKEMRIFQLPWPTEALRDLGNLNVTLRVALSSFISPNPAEASRGSRYRYASHNLRFKLNRAGENQQQFMARISKAVDQGDPIVDEDDNWEYGSVRRDVGSLHIDQLTCRASDLARRNFLAVHPVAGWWKSKAKLKLGEPAVRFALIVEIDTQGIEVDLYAEVEAAVVKINAVQAVAT
jgi:hypothetical protein